jgi:hypothetical protein
MHTLKFNVGTCDVHQFPQTAGNAIHKLLEEVVWDIGDNVPSPCFQFPQCERFCTVHLILCPAPQEKVTGLRSGPLAGHSWGPRRPRQAFAKWDGAPSCMKIWSSMFSQPDTVGRSQTDKRQDIFIYYYAYSLSWPLPALPTRER